MTLALAVLDPDFKIRGGGGGGRGVGAQSSRPLDKGRGWSPKKFFFFGLKIRGGGLPWVPHCFRYHSSCRFLFSICCDGFSWELWSGDAGSTYTSTIS